MSYFEYIVEVPVDDKVEDKTKELLAMVNNVSSPLFYINEYYDRVTGVSGETETKKRTFTIMAYANINHIMGQLFYGYATKISCYHKTPVIVW
jgi:hypothetical protein